MSVVIRMKRAGATKRPFYRVVVTDSRNPRDGRYIEQLGYYDPLTDPATFQIDAVRFSEWIRRGALPSESVGVMVKKHAPEAFLPAPPPMMEPVADEKPVAKVKKAKPAKVKGKAAKTKVARKPKASTKGKDKKAKGRAKAKANKASGIVKPKKAKKAKK
jgi:small subunit ribosomal protein S16